MNVCIYGGDKLARNKYPEETVKQILNISMKLFMEKGYEKTTIQDIVDELGMSKGAIYHHFKSKEDIVEAIWTQGVDVYYDWEKKFKKSSFANAKERLENIFIYSLKNEYKQKADAVSMPFLQNPKFLSYHLNRTLNVAPPLFIEIINEGNADGSFKVENPKEVAEIMCLLLNIWINPVVFSGTKQEVIERVEFFGQLILRLGVHININRINEAFGDYYDRVFKSNENI